MTLHPSIRAACRTLAQAGIGFTVVATPPWADLGAGQGYDRGAAERRRPSRHGEDHQLDFGFDRPAYSHKTPGQRPEYAAPYA